MRIAKRGAAGQAHTDTAYGIMDPWRAHCVRGRVARGWSKTLFGDKRCVRLGTRTEGEGAGLRT